MSVDLGALSRRASNAAIWSAVDGGARLVAQLVIAAILARVLTPEDFGAVASLQVFMSLAMIVADGGLSTAMIRRATVSTEDESTVFWINIALSALVALLMFLCAQPISNFYQLPILAQVVPILALNVPLAALGTLWQTRLTKRMDYRRSAQIGILATTVAGGIAIGLAILGLGLWALVVQSLCSTAINTLLLWRYDAWRPRFLLSARSARSLFRDGIPLLLSAILDGAFNQMQTLVLGKIFGIRDLAIYMRAETTKQLPTAIATGTFTRLMLPVLAAVAHDVQALRSGVRRISRCLMTMNAPLMLGLAACSDNVVSLLFGEQWSESAPLLRILCIGSVLWPLHVVNLSVIVVQGYANRFLRLEIIKKIFGVAILLGTLPFGLVGIAWGQVLFSIVAFIVNSNYSGKTLAFGTRAQFFDVLPVIAIAMVMSLVVYSIPMYVSLPVGILLLLQVCSGIVVYAALCASFRLDAWRDSIRFAADAHPMLRRILRPISQ